MNIKAPWLGKKLPIALLAALLSTTSGVCADALRGPSEQVNGLLPNSGEILTDGTTIRVSIDVTLIPSSYEAIEYRATLIVNGCAYRPFKTSLTQDRDGVAIKGRETMSWFVPVVGPKVKLRFLLTGTGKKSGTTLSFFDETQDHRVVCDQGEFVILRLLRRSLGRCG